MICAPVGEPIGTSWFIAFTPSWPAQNHADALDKPRNIFRTGFVRRARKKAAVCRHSVQSRACMFVRQRRRERRRCRGLAVFARAALIGPQRCDARRSASLREKQPCPVGTQDALSSLAQLSGRIFSCASAAKPGQVFASSNREGRNG
jgi:hypothetical protein